MSKVDIDLLSKCGIIASSGKELCEQDVNSGFRMWSRNNHPDKGGDLQRFQTILAIVNKVKCQLCTPKVCKPTYTFTSNSTEKPKPTGDGYQDWINFSAWLKFMKRWNETRTQSTPKKQSEAKAKPTPKPKKEKAKKKETTTNSTEDRFYNEKTGYYVKRGTRTFKKYVKDGWILDEVNKHLIPPK